MKTEGDGYAAGEDDMTVDMSDGTYVLDFAFTTLDDAIEQLRDRIASYH